MSLAGSVRTGPFVRLAGSLNVGRGGGYYAPQAFASPYYASPFAGGYGYPYGGGVATYANGGCVGGYAAPDFGGAASPLSRPPVIFEGGYPPTFAGPSPFAVSPPSYGGPTIIIIHR